VRVSKNVTSSKDWLIGFNTALTGREVEQHLEDQLAPLSFGRSAVGRGTLSSTYVSPDGLVVVHLSKFKDFPPRGSAFPRPPKGHKYDFSLSVRILAEPSGHAKFAESLQEGSSDDP
jgi:hypothetical protein